MSSLGEARLICFLPIPALKQPLEVGRSAPYAHICLKFTAIITKASGELGVSFHLLRCPPKQGRDDK